MSSLKWEEPLWAVKREEGTKGYAHRLSVSDFCSYPNEIGDCTRADGTSSRIAALMRDWNGSDI